MAQDEKVVALIWGWGINRLVSTLDRVVPRRKVNSKPVFRGIHSVLSSSVRDKEALLGGQVRTA